MPIKSYFSSKVVKAANARLCESGVALEPDLPQELLGVVSSARKTRAELRAAFELAYTRLREG
ncbi:hypothetical protein ACQKPE_13485 [Pseudomonas sp. NPDC089554]|uniref:hypothetical protein n=1 Tax=Pseudomonas sp. NPDC089554 TaxID=3390653 RepID=UPI003D04D882